MLKKPSALLLSVLAFSPLVTGVTLLLDARVAFAGELSSLDKRELREFDKLFARYDGELKWAKPKDMQSDARYKKLKGAVDQFNAQLARVRDKAHPDIQAAHARVADFAQRVEAVRAAGLELAKNPEPVTSAAPGELQKAVIWAGGVLTIPEIPAAATSANNANTQAVNTLRRIRGDLLRDLCYRGDAYVPGKLDNVQDNIDHIPEPDEAKRYVVALAQVRAFIDWELNGPIEHGGWKGLGERMDKLGRLAKQRPGTAAEVKAAIAVLRKVEEDSRADHQLALELSKKSVCAGQLAKAWLAKTDAAFVHAALQKHVWGFAGIDLKHHDAMLEETAKTVAAQPDTSWGAAARPTTLARRVRAVREDLPNAVLLAAWSEFLDASPETERMKTADKVDVELVAKLIPLTREALEQALPPKGTGNGKLMAIARTQWKGAIEVRVTSGELKGDRDEAVEKDGKVYQVRFKYTSFWGMWILKDAKYGEFDLLVEVTGRKRDELCALKSVLMIKYEKGMDVELGKWTDGSDAIGGTVILCKHKGATSKLPNDK